MKESFHNVFSLEGQTAIITGGATGLGFAIAECVSSAGAKVIIVGRKPENELKEACSKIENAVYYQFDVTDIKNSQDLVNKIIEEQGKIDILVNNAGVHCKKPVEEMTMEDFSRVLNVHLFGAYSLTKAVIPHMRQRKTGNVIFLSSMAALFGLTNVSAYSAAKSSVLGLARSIASEVSCDNVRINAIAPGFIDSPMFRKATDGDIPRQQKILGRTPMKKYGEARDIGWGVVYLCSSAASFVTGTCLVIDGGCSIGF